MSTGAAPPSATLAMMPISPIYHYSSGTCVPPNLTSRDFIIKFLNFYILNEYFF